MNDILTESAMIRCRADLMFDKDIALHVYTKDLNAAQTQEVFGPLFRAPRIQRLYFINGSETGE